MPEGRQSQVSARVRGPAPHHSPVTCVSILGTVLIILISVRCLGWLFVLLCPLPFEYAQQADLHWLELPHKRHTQSL